ncbi:erythromycin esterase family protein [Kitasatospora albolonga]|uniref:erythromycin esterase family protein n=1 Tax=Kitasatospora albolonga TaxID=68173 RepID=UPI0031F0598C
MTSVIHQASRPFDGAALAALLPPDVRLLGLGEPTHNVEVFLDLRNDLFRHLVEHHGYRSVALESDALSASVADAFLADGTGSLDHALEHGISHGFGALTANRELLQWMRAWNTAHPPEQRLRFHGVDAPLEITGAQGPGPALLALYDLLAEHLEPQWNRAELVDLLGPEERWSDPAALTDPSASVGRTPEAARLRLAADDLSTLLAAEAPLLAAATSPDRLWRAGLYARTARGLLRYHSALADDGPGRMSTIMGLRDLMMADNARAVVEREADRGPTLLFAHNRHLQREKSVVPFGDGQLAWWGTGALLAERLGPRYAFAASTFGTRGHDIAAPDTLEGLLAAEQPHARAVVDPALLAAALPPGTPPRITADPTSFALDPATVALTDAVLFVREIAAAPAAAQGT